MNKDFWENKKVLITGGSGLLGKHLLPILRKTEGELFAPRRKDYDLRFENEVISMFKGFRPDIVIHMAVNGGGIGYMSNNPGSIYYDNVTMNTNVVHNSFRNNVKKFVGIGTVCEYPKHTPVPFREENLWNGYPEETNAPYGISKRMMLMHTQSYSNNYGFNGIHLLLANLYGPRDNFKPERSHAIPALIQKMINAKEGGESKVVLWGTGNASREFLFVEDAANAIIIATEKYDKPEPLNIGSGKEIKIRDLAEKIKIYTGFKGEIIWDTSKPDGQPRRHLDVSKAKKYMDFKAKTDFDEGLRKTIKWYLRYRDGKAD
ncbi:MAG: GDP-L-fucose synthase [Candidatus Aenigmatarchaeota archaeon]|nr:MAG: GDP-L-fucose synthase [Candidatus Aenigmarchaeota archaeon]